MVGVADANGLVKPHAYVVARERHEDLAEELKSFVRDRLEPYKHPREVIFVDSLPTTPQGGSGQAQGHAETTPRNPRSSRGSHR